MTNADLVLIGEHTGLAVRQGRIAALGASVTELIGPRTEVVDLAGRLLLPGFQDAHIHAVLGGLELGQCDLTGTTDLKEYRRRIRAYADAHPEAGWITGGGWSMESFANGIPTSALLDDVVPDRPVFLFNRDHHGACEDHAGRGRGELHRGNDRSLQGLLRRAGARLAAGSDWPVSDPGPLAAIHTAVNRATHGSGEPAFLPEQKLDLQTALAAYTSGSAYVNHRDDSGTLAVGQRADLVVLDRDPFAGPATEIGAASVDLTFVDGVRVHGLA
jgi:predicted amidohydrolase YtcJ